MAASSRPGQAPPPTAKVSDVIANFAPTRRFGPSANQKPYSVTSLDFDDTGELCLVSQDDETLQIYNCKEGKHAKELKSQKYGVDLARFAHHPQSIIYASTKGDDSIRYLSSHDNSYIRYFRGHTAPVTCIALNPASDEFLSCSHDNTVRLWDLRSPSPQGQLNLNKPYIAAYDPTATVLAIASPVAQTLLLYDARAYDKSPFGAFDLRGKEQHFRGMETRQKNGGAEKTPNGEDANDAYVPPGDWTKVEFSNDGTKIVIATSSGGHYLLDSFEGHLIRYLARPQGGTGRVPPLGLSLLRREQQLKKSSAGSPGYAASGQGDCCFSPDGRYVVGGSGSDKLYVWNVRDLKPLKEEDGRVRDFGAEHVMQPSFEVEGGVGPGGGSGSGIGGMAAALVAYNPRHNMLVTADKGVVMWLPEMD